MATVIKESGGGGGGAMAAVLFVVILLVVAAIAWFVFAGGEMPSAGNDVNLNVEVPKVEVPAVK